MSYDVHSKGITLLRKTVLLLYCVITFILIGCTERTPTLSEKIQEELRRAKISYTEVIHTEMVNNGLLVFFSNPERYVIAGYLEYSSNGWKWVTSVGGVSLDKGGHLLQANTGMPFYVDWGILVEPTVANVTVKGNQAKLITTVSGVRLWIHYPEQPSSGKDIVYVKTRP